MESVVHAAENITEYLGCLGINNVVDKFEL